MDTVITQQKFWKYFSVTLQVKKKQETLGCLKNTSRKKWPQRCSGFEAIPNKQGDRSLNGNWSLPLLGSTTGCFLWRTTSCLYNRNCFLCLVTEIRQWLTASKSMDIFFPGCVICYVLHIFVYWMSLWSTFSNWKLYKFLFLFLLLLDKVPVR